MSIPCHQTMTKDLRMAVNGQKEETFPVSYTSNVSSRKRTLDGGGELHAVNSIEAYQCAHVKVPSMKLYGYPGIVSIGELTMVHCIVSALTTLALQHELSS
jgi:hypothetical protein